MLNKIYPYIFGSLIIIVLISGWYIFNKVEENGILKKDNATLKQSLEDSEKENKKLKAIADLNADTVAKAAEVKNKLLLESAKLVSDLEILKHENAEIKKWANNIMPGILACKLLDTTNKDAENRLYCPTKKPVKTNTGAQIEVQNENLYKYADELKTAVRSCNADKAALRAWYEKAGIILH